MTQKTSSSFTVCHNFALEINYFPVLLSVRALLARLPKRNKRKVVSGSRVTLPENFACKPGLSFNPLARVTLAVGLPYLLVNRALKPQWESVQVCQYLSISATLARSRPYLRRQLSGHTNDTMLFACPLYMH